MPNPSQIERAVAHRLQSYLGNTDTRGAVRFGVQVGPKRRDEGDGRDVRGGPWYIRVEAVRCGREQARSQRCRLAAGEIPLGRLGDLAWGKHESLTGMNVAVSVQAYGSKFGVGRVGSKFGVRRV